MEKYYKANVLAELLNLTERRVQQLAKEGVIKKVTAGKYDLIPSVQGYVAYLQEKLRSGVGEGDYQQEKTMLTKAQREAQELKNAQTRGELVEMSKLVRYVSDVGQAFKAKVVNIGAKYGPMARAASTDAEAAAIIKNGTDEALRELQRVFDPDA